MFSGLYKNKNHSLRQFYGRYISKIQGAEAIKSLALKAFLKIAPTASYKFISASVYAHCHGLEKTTLIPSTVENIPVFRFYDPARFSPPSM